MSTRKLPFGKTVFAAFSSINHFRHSILFTGLLSIILCSNSNAGDITVPPILSSITTTIVNDSVDVRISGAFLMDPTSITVGSCGCYSNSQSFNTFGLISCRVPISCGPENAQVTVTTVDGTTTSDDFIDIPAPPLPPAVPYLISSSDPHQDSLYNTLLIDFDAPSVNPRRGTYKARLFPGDTDQTFAFFSPLGFPSQEFQFLALTGPLFESVMQTVDYNVTADSLVFDDSDTNDVHKMVYFTASGSWPDTSLPTPSANGTMTTFPGYDPFSQVAVGFSILNNSTVVRSDHNNTTVADKFRLIYGLNKSPAVNTTGNEAYEPKMNVTFDFINGPLPPMVVDSIKTLDGPNGVSATVTFPQKYTKHFQGTNVGDTSRTTFYVRNTSDSVLNTSDIIVQKSGNQATSFSISSFQSGTIAVGDSTSFELMFHPFNDTVTHKANFSFTTGGNLLYNIPAVGTSLGTPDLTPPTVSITSSVGDTSAANPLIVTITFSEPVVGFGTQHITRTQAPIVFNPILTTNDNTVFQLQLTTFEAGTVYISVPAGSVADTAGNLNLASNQFTTYNITAPKFTYMGNMEVGDTLFVNPEDIDSIGTDAHFQWYRSDSRNDPNKVMISGATDSTYILKPEDKGKFISVSAAPQSGKYTALTLDTETWGPVADPAAFGASKGITGPLVFELNPEDIPANSPFQLNTGSLGLLLPGLSQVYGSTAPCKIYGYAIPNQELTISLQGNSSTSGFDYYFHLYALDLSLGQFVRAASMSGAISFITSSKDTLQNVKSNLNGMSWSAITVDFTNIGTINTFALVFKLNLASAGLTFATNGDFKERLFPMPYAVGSDTISDPFEIADLQGLQAMKFFTESPFELVNDLDASSTVSWNDSTGFAPIGTSSSAPFEGSLKGNGFNIDALTINRPSADNQGLFGFLEGHVSQLGLTNISVNGNDDVGALAGQSEGAIISEVFTRGSVAGNNSVGGLIGNSAQNDSIVNSYSITHITGTEGGGLFGNSSSSTKLVNSYSSGGGTPSEGLAGFNHGTSATNSYWNVDSVTISSMGLGLTSSALKVEANLTNWDFDSIWIINPFLNSGFPHLRVFLLSSPLDVALQADSNVSCPGLSDGGLTATPSGGIPPYSYMWNTGDTTATISGLPKGTYTITITDSNSDTTSASVDITQPDTLQIGFVLDNSIGCNGDLTGGITAQATGGTAPHSYLWSTGDTTSSISGLGAGVYTVAITDNNGCATTDSFSINEPAPLQTNASVDSTPSCLGAANAGASVQITGGTPPYSVSWSSGGNTPSIGGLTSGEYYVTTTDSNGCSSLDTVIIAPGLPLSVAINQGDTAFSCNGLAVNLSTNTNGSHEWFRAGHGRWDSIGNRGFSPDRLRYLDMAFDSQGTPYVAFADKSVSYAVSVMKYDGSNWQNVGNSGFTSSEADYVQIEMDGNTPYVSFQDDDNGNGPSVMTFDGTVWDTVGQVGFSGDESWGEVRMTLVNSHPWIVYGNDDNGGKVKVWRYDGSTWQLAGDNLSAGLALRVDIHAEDTIPYIAVSDNGNSGKLTVLSHAGSNNWDTVGTAAFTPTGTGSNINLKIHEGDPYVAFNGDHTTSQKASVMKYDGTAWNAVGNAEFTSGSATDPVLDFHNKQPLISFANGSQSGKLSVMHYDGSTWDYLGDTTVSEANAGYPQLEVNNGIPYVTFTQFFAHIDGRASMMAFADSVVSTSSVFNTSEIGKYYVKVIQAGSCVAYDTVYVQDAPPILIDSLSITDVTCTGGSDASVQVTLSGGQTPYSFSWNDGSNTYTDNNALPAGTFTLTVTDANGCTASQSNITIGEPMPLSGGKVSGLQP